jgi:hypothetical protein
MPKAKEAKCPCGARAVGQGLCADCIEAPNPPCDDCGQRHIPDAPWACSSR